MTGRSSGQKHWPWIVLFAATALWITIGVGWRGLFSPQPAQAGESQAGPPKAQPLPDDLIGVSEAEYASLEGLAPGSQEAQERQREAVQQLGLPLEVKTRRTGIVFRLVAPANLTMGTPEGAWYRGGYKGLGPENQTEHQVTLTRPFYCAKFEVTQGQWEQVMGSNPSFFKNVGREGPVEQVSWEDCQTFVKELCRIEGVREGTYRLLTEAEWEHACRAGTRTTFYTGEMVADAADSPLMDEIGWYASNGGDVTHPVGGKRPNGFGLYDMNGNVEEWCQDWHGAFRSRPLTDPCGPPVGNQRVRRGGCYYWCAELCRSGERYGGPVGFRTKQIGLRLARTVPSREEGKPTSEGDKVVEPSVPPVGAVTASSWPADLEEVGEAEYAPLEGLAPGSREAQERQRRAVRELRLPLEVRTCKTGIVFRLVPAGSFTMGSPKKEQDAMVKAHASRKHVQGETRHEVTLTKPFYCGKFEVTLGQWERVMERAPQFGVFKNAGKDAPVEPVSWNDCQVFVDELCRLEGVPQETYRLLTEAEWEYACRAGTQTALYNGDLVVKGLNNGPALDMIAWYGGNSGVEYEGGEDSTNWRQKQYDHRRAGPHPVGGKRANAFGLHDMIGNVDEWCQDWYGEYPTDAVTDPLGPPSGVYRICRGNSWRTRGVCCRSAERAAFMPDRMGWWHEVGCRLARVTPASP
ncbi:MAG: formylglycine-generating enzyme family protein [Sedimentisphaerales bacterium]|nr:formylglycine-generating enzyme family protein [Sedimentisphaerales bacterium]